MKSHFKFGRVVMRMIGKKMKVLGREHSSNKGQYIPTLQPSWYNGRRLNDFYFCKFDGLKYIPDNDLQKLIYRAKHRRLYLTYKNDIKVNLKEK